MHTEQIIFRIKLEIVKCEHHLYKGNKPGIEGCLRRIRKLIPTELFDLRKATKSKD